ncbi:MAG: F0F1 ATP synthase subunit delta [Gemmatimonadaceae bacterium]
MRNSTIAANYAEALLALAQKTGDLDAWGGMISALADAMQREPRLYNFLAAPQVAAVEKKRVIEKAFAGQVPRLLIRFVQKLVDNRRQMLLPDIATEYANLVDKHAGRVHAQVTVARDTSDADRTMIAQQLSTKLGKAVVAHLHVNPDILGGLVVKIGDTVMDGSVRRRISTLRSRLVAVR